jgi:DNA-directed RNA polymerase subunit M/transcription elongation factor TFIIS
MHFCSECNNMYYLKITSEDANTLIYYCRNCGHEDDMITSENICVSNTELKRSEQKYTHIINEYTKLDPTLPRINTIKCPNQECISNKSVYLEEEEVGKKKQDASIEQQREVIYIRYDDINLKYIYVCAKCDKMWKTDNNN